MTSKIMSVLGGKNGALTPPELLAMAVNKGADVEQIEKLMDLQVRWEAKEAKKLYITALSTFRAVCPTITRSRQGHNSKYAGLAETIEEIKDLMSANGLSHAWTIEQNDQLVSVKCHLTHVGGHSETSTMSAAPDDTGNKNSIQALGSTVSYLERYTFFALLGLASREMDDDGAGSTEFITEEQVADLDAIIDEIGANKEAFLKVCKIDQLSQLPAARFDGALKRLEQRR